MIFSHRTSLVLASIPATALLGACGGGGGGGGATVSNSSGGTSGWVQGQFSPRSVLIRAALEAELRRERINVLEARHVIGYARQPTVPANSTHGSTNESGVFDEARRRTSARRGIDKHRWYRTHQILI
jgi:hypothetical protein